MGLQNGRRFRDLGRTVGQSANPAHPGRLTAILDEVEHAVARLDRDHKKERAHLSAGGGGPRLSAQRRGHPARR